MGKCLLPGATTETNQIYIGSQKTVPQQQEMNLLVARGNNFIQYGGYIRFIEKCSQSSPQTGSRIQPKVTI